MSFENFGKDLKIEVNAFAFDINSFPCLSGFLKNEPSLNFNEEIVLHRNYLTIAKGNCAMLENVVFNVTACPDDINETEKDWTIQELNGLSFNGIDITSGISKEESRKILYALNQQEHLFGDEGLKKNKELYCQTIVCK